MTEAVDAKTVTAKTADEFLVFYSLSGVTLAHAASAEAASGKVLKSLNSMIRNVNIEGINSTEANVVRLHECEAKVISTEAIIYHCQPTEDEIPTTQVMGLPGEEETLAAKQNLADEVHAEE